MSYTSMNIFEPQSTAAFTALGYASTILLTPSWFYFSSSSYIWSLKSPTYESRTWLEVKASNTCFRQFCGWQQISRDQFSGLYVPHTLRGNASTYGTNHDRVINLPITSITKNISHPKCSPHSLLLRTTHSNRHTMRQ
jgi:hypothetical protein